MRALRVRTWFGLVLAAVLLSPATAGAEPAALYAEHCASCHGAERLGGTGPALLPQNLRRLKKKRAAPVIARGRPQTQMPAFAETLTAAEIESLVGYIFTPPAVAPTWTLEAIKASRTIPEELKALPATPIHDSDPLGLFVVVESGDHHVTILDGDRFEPIHRFPSRFALHGGPKFSPDGRFVYFASRDGWVTKFDLYSLQVLAEIRAGINTRNLAISHDGKVIAVANYLPHTLVLLDAEDLKLLEVVAVGASDGQTTSRVSAVYQAAPRGSFVLALKDLPEIWEIPYADQPAADFPVGRIALSQPLDDFFFDPEYRHVFGSARGGKKSVVVDLDARREIAEVPLTGLPHLGSGITWMRDGKRVLATPHLKDSAVSVVDMSDWSIIKKIPTEGPGFFMRSHENSPYAWVDVFFGPNRDAVHVIDKKTLEVVRTLRPAPGKTAAHVEFSRDGRHALLSIWDMEGALVVYDSKTLEEVKRIPMVKPSGKYNVYNKITRSEGTSH